MTVYAGTCFTNCQSTAEYELILAKVKNVFQLFFLSRSQSFIFSPFWTCSHLSLVSVSTNEELLPGDSPLFPPIIFPSLFSPGDSCDWVMIQCTCKCRLMRLAGLFLYRYINTAEIQRMCLDGGSEGGWCLCSIHKLEMGKKDDKHILKLLFGTSGVVFRGQSDHLLCKNHVYTSR